MKSDFAVQRCLCPTQMVPVSLSSQRPDSLPSTRSFRWPRTLDISTFEPKTLRSDGEESRPTKTSESLYSPTLAPLFTLNPLTRNTLVREAGSRQNHPAQKHFTLCSLFDTQVRRDP